MTMENETLDGLLSKPLSAIADDGFSARIMARVGARQRRETILYFAASFACGIAALFLVPFAALGDAIAHVTPQIAGSVPLCIAISTIVLTLSLDQWVRER